MQSRNAYILGSFVIPEGGGPDRIEFDAENGLILVYQGDVLANSIGAAPGDHNGFTSYNTSVFADQAAGYQYDGVWIDDNGAVGNGAMWSGGHIMWKNPRNLTNYGGYFEITAPRIEQLDPETGIQVYGRSRDNTFSPQGRFATSDDTDRATWEFCGTVYAAVGEIGASGVVPWTREVFKALGFAAGWGNFGAPYASGQYKMMADGTVRLRGLISGPVVANGTTIATIPAGYRPAAQCIFPVASGTPTTHGGIVITTAGNIQIWGGLPECSLEGITYSVVNT